MDDSARWYEERQSMIAAQQQAYADQQVQAARLMAAQPDLWQQTTLPAGDWGVPQEWQLEQQQNAREAELAREHVREQERFSLER
jgi:hypothetical protein